MKYDLSAVEMLKMLGYDQPTGREWLEKLKQEKQISLPKAYTEFMELMVDCPLLGTSNLWIGKMEHKMSACIPCTFYDQLQEMIDDRKGRWSKRPGRYERSLYDLFQLPAEEWLQAVDNYLVIGSDYAGGMGEFGIRIEDLQKDDPPVYWHKDADGFSMWKLENEKLSDFLLNVLIEALACVDYQSAEYELETKGWRYEEYFDLKKDDWVASKSVLKRYGIDYPTIKKYKASSGKVFCCYDEDRNALFVGSTAEGEISLSAINRNEAEHIFLDIDSLEYLFEEARLCIKDREREDELSQYYIYTKTPKTKVNLSDYCQADKPPQKGEDGESICPVTAKKEALYILCSGTDFMEVITRVLQKKPKAMNEELLEALNDYLQTRNL
ncbi:hypothetical protein IMSAGC007_04228 [Lachnospiraceae bacterium]|nr:hypothetical protein IMSAGC007_04228 [Lachnospiraceae bacterium]GFI29399.1 hypothetical protein IMSAGC013_00785 [Lachnospiraceae bacterium]